VTLDFTTPLKVNSGILTRRSNLKASAFRSARHNREHDIIGDIHEYWPVDLQGAQSLS